MGFINLTLKSRNQKVGKVPVSTSGKQTCPDTCPLKESGACYADGGPLSLFWDKVSKQEAGTDYNSFVDAVRGLPDGQFWRHNQAGDLAPTKRDPNTIDAPALVKLVEANKGKMGFTFTHYDPIKNLMNEFAIHTANKNGFTINLSGNNVFHADELAKTKCGPVVSVLPLEYQRQGKGKEFTESLDAYKSRLADLPKTTPAGNRIVICPATYKEGMSCNDCRLCAKANRKTIVGFPAHGRSKRKADAIAQEVA